jgi:hypothetical protein
VSEVGEAPAWHEGLGLFFGEWRPLSGELRYSQSESTIRVV